MKKFELESIKKCVAEGEYRVENNSYGTSGSGFVINFRLFIDNKEHQEKFNRRVYFLCFSSQNWYKVKYESMDYNFRFLEKYRQYDVDIHRAVYGDRKELSVLLK